MSRYTHLVGESGEKSNYVYQSPRKQVVMMVPPGNKRSNLRNAYNTSSTFYQDNNVETQDTQTKLLFSQSANAPQYLQYNTLSQGLNTGRANHETINSQSDEQTQNVTSPYSNSIGVGQKSLKQQLKLIKPRIMGIKQNLNSTGVGQTASSGYGKRVQSKQDRNSEQRQPPPFIERENEKRIKGNHIQNSIKIMRQEERIQQGRSNINSFNTGNFDRIGKELQKTRMGFGIRNEREELNELMRSTDSTILRKSPDKTVIPPPKAIVPNLEDERFKELERDQIEFHGQPPGIFIKNKQAEKWMSKRKVQAGGQNTTNRKHVEFAKNLFISWDDDGSGVLEAEEIIKPLVGLGLSSDSKFAVKILQSLDPKNDGSQKGKDDLRITLKDFIKIFKSDKVSENLVSIINSEVNQLKMQQQETQIVKPPAQRVKHPDFKSPRNASNEQDSNMQLSTNKSKISVSMRTNDHKKIIEIPMDKYIDQISIHQKIFDRNDGQHKYRTQVYKVKGGQQLADPFENYIQIRDDNNSQQTFSAYTNNNQHLHTQNSDVAAHNQDQRRFLSTSPIIKAEFKGQKKFNKEGQQNMLANQVNVRYHSKDIAAGGQSQQSEFGQHSSHHYSNRNPVQKTKNITLQEQMEIIKGWWKQMDPNGNVLFEHSINTVCGFMVKKRLASDKEQAAKIIFGQLGMATRKDNINFDEFNRVFCKGIFKEALINVTNTFDQMSMAKQSVNDLPLSLKINEYQRSQMFSGLDPKSEYYKEGRQILNSLNQIKEEEGQMNDIADKRQPTNEGNRYQNFLEDPLGQKIKLKEEDEKQKKQSDPFVDRIKFIEDVEKSHQARRPVNDTRVDSDLSNKLATAIMAKRNNKMTLLETKQRYQDDSQMKKNANYTTRDQDQARQLRNQESKEQVKIPAVYLEKSKEERLKDQNELLSRFQKLLSMHPQMNSEI
ncbi:iki3 domain containing protein [Stylonychia lemnae]|uniref:Iki3 domain containing protein n=1 Tax=Stylonychia lemnae TaxID=5949 RepID=A0A078A1J7_STYLE|nr:iki3 domain containing protein [Stylonychia lemnae]|eukprot:CDW75722.1 iki3 domain containing protein [Stylonychia lemnae]